MFSPTPFTFAIALATTTISLAATDRPPAQPALPSPTLRQIKVLPDKAPDCSTLKFIADTVTRGCQTNDQKAIAIYNFMQLTHYHHAYPSETGGLPVLKEINSYGWSLCGGLHAEQSALWRQLGWDWRFVGWDGHTTVEAKYDGKWHYLDVFLKFYAWMPDPSAPGGRTIAGEDDLAKNSATLVQNAFILDRNRNCVYAKDNQFVRTANAANWRAPAFLCCGDILQDVINGLKTHRGSDHSEGWAAIVHADGGYSADVNLAPGFFLTNTWDRIEDAWFWSGSKKPPQHTCGGHKDTRNDPGIGLILEPYVTSKPARSYANGILTFAPDFSTDAFLRSFVSTRNVKWENNRLLPADSANPGVVVVALASPYVIARASGLATGADSAEVSTDGGQVFRPIDLKEFSEVVKGQVAVQVRLTFRQALTALKLKAIVQNNAGSLPYLSPGRNTIAVSAADPQALGDNKLVITYAYRLGSRAKSFEQLCDEGKEIAKAHNAAWDDQITCVQKAFFAKDLPATFTIDCPTPKSRYPVYPRMLFIRREIIAPSSLPSPIPIGAVEARPGQPDELIELPNPFLTGAGGGL